MDEKQKLFGSFLRLRDFPLDFTCIYKTYDLANEYVEKNKTAYAGQVIGVFDDGDKTGVYVIVKTTIGNGLMLQKSANDSDLKKLKDEINSEVKVALDKLETDVEKLKEEHSNFIERLDEHDSSITENTEEISKLKEIIGGTGEGSDSILDQIKELRKDLDYLTNNDDISDTLDSVAEIAEWIRKNQNIIDSFLTLKTEVDVINKKLSETEITTNTNKSNIEGIDKRVSIIEADYVKHEEIDELLKNASGVIEYSFNSTNDGFISGIDTPFGKVISKDKILTEVSIEIKNAATSQSSFSLSLKDDEQVDDRVFLVSSNSEDNISLIYPDEAGIYTYILNYKLEYNSKLMLNINLAEGDSISGKIIAKFE